MVLSETNCSLSSLAGTSLADVMLNQKLLRLHQFPHPAKSHDITIASWIAQGACSGLRDLDLSSSEGYEKRGLTLFKVCPC